MKRRSKIIVSVSAGVLLGLAVAGWQLYQANFIGKERFDADFYAAAGPPGEFSVDGYAATLRKYVDAAGMVNYRQLADDHAELDAFLLAMARVSPELYQSWDADAQLAFWINAYNALTLKAIIDHYPIEAGLLSGLAHPDNSIRQIPGVWDKILFLVVGQRMTLDDIEHSILRGQASGRIGDYGEFDEPRIHVALVCAAMSCPSLRNEPFVGGALAAQLDDQAERMVSAPSKFRIDHEAGKVYLSSIFKWFGTDFVKRYAPAEGFGSGGDDAEKAVLHLISGYLPAADAEFLRTGTYAIEYLDYDWTLNEQAR